MEEDQKFQSEMQLFALKVHRVVARVIDAVLMPFQALGNLLSATPGFRDGAAAIERAERRAARDRRAGFVS